jgi:transketolase
MQSTKELAKLIRYFILTSTTNAGSGHPTSSLSATDLMSVLFFEGFFKYDIDKPHDSHNDRLIFSKGHASPLFYSLWAAAGAIKAKELETLRQFGSNLEGHPTPDFPFADITTGSLGQGLSVGCGFAINGLYLDHLDYKTYVLLGDSEMAEGSNWEAINCAAYYKLHNLIAIVDVNRLGQNNETIEGWNTHVFEKKFQAFGWNTIIIDGHSYEEIKLAYTLAHNNKDKPLAIIAKTVKGKGISFLENKENWHGKVLKKDELEASLIELGHVNLDLRGNVIKPLVTVLPVNNKNVNPPPPSYKIGEMVSTRKAYGESLAKLGKYNNDIVALDGETENSTFSELFKNAFPDRFFEMYIAEQNMVGVALGLSKYQKDPFASTFSAFFTRAFDQIRISQYSEANITFVGSHAGVSIGQDGPSQMGLEDLSMFSSILKSSVLYPSDAVSTEKIVAACAKQNGIKYIRTTRMDTPVLYQASDDFYIGGSKMIRMSSSDQITVIGAGVTLHEALKAYELLKKENINIRVIDLYSIKPIDEVTIIKANNETQAIVTVEDHYPHGGIGDAVLATLAKVKNKRPLYKLAVNTIPRSGKPEELLKFEEISADAIVTKVREIISLS